MYKNKDKKLLYSVWYNMISRCNNPNYHNYKNYGYKGIKICDEWLVFENFYEWSISNGYKNKLTIDRIDNSKNYTKDNCRWVDWKVQENNRTNNRIETYNGITDTVANLCRKFDKDYELIRKRINAGKMSITEAFDTQKRNYTK